MSFYEKFLLPKLLNAAMKNPAFKDIRQRLVPHAEGKVLEIGVGSGLNLPFYNANVHVTALDPSEELQVYAREVADREGINVDFLTAGGEEIPADDNSFDSVVMTWTLCTIPDPVSALAELRRVLKPGGRIVFAEHGIAPDERVARWQGRLNPMWRVIGGGCNLNRPIEQLYRSSGFSFDDIDRGYLPGPKFATYNYRGLARLT